MKTTIYVIRHGETDYNKRALIQGQSNSRLTENGVHAQLYANNLHFFGDEEEIIRAVVDFFAARV